ncbi:MAG: hypothetical protein ACK56I_15235, partial [bacterium]
MAYQPRQPRLPQLPAANPLAGPGGFKQSRLLPVAQPVRRWCGRDGEPLLQSAGLEVGGLSHTGAQTCAKAAEIPNISYGPGARGLFCGGGAWVSDEAPTLSR